MSIQRIMNTFVKHILFSILFATVYSTQAVELTGRFSMLGTTAKATQGDIGYTTKDNTLSADQQSLRLMLDETHSNSEWSLHIKTTRLHLSDITASDTHSSDLFRYDSLSSYWLNETESNNTTRFGYEVDRAVYKQRFANSSLTLGRQSIDWGSGSFWQPLNVFGAFAPTDLDTDYKPGIDAFKFDWFPSQLSSLSTVYIFSPKDNATVDKSQSAALYYRRQVGEQDELALLAAGVIGNSIVGASYQGAWGGMGWRLEAAHYQPKTGDAFNFLIAGLNYQFSNGTIFNTEWYHHTRGASTVTELSATNVLTDTFIKYGLQQHLSKDVLGISLNKDISPLWNGSYTLLLSPLEDNNNNAAISLLHQLTFIYSVSNESDLLFSLQTATGSGKNQLGQLQSEFGHLPASATLRLRFYF